MGTFKTQAAFAQALGITEGTLSKYLKRPSWPASRKAPFSECDLQQGRAYQANLREDRSGKTAPPAAPVGSGLNVKELHEKVKLQLDEQRRRKAKVEADLAESAVMPHELHLRAVIGLARLFVSRLAVFKGAALRELDGDRQKNADVLEAHINRLREDLHEKVLIELAGVDDELMRKYAKRRGRKGGAAPEATS